MTASPSVGVSKYLEVKNGSLALIPANQYAAGNLLLGSAKSAKLGAYLIGSSAMTLYTYAKDSAGVSACSGVCAENWPPYLVATTSALANLQSGISGETGSLTRDDGSLQVTYKGMPLYYYIKDTKSGDTTGQNVGGVWKVAKP